MPDGTDMPNSKFLDIASFIIPSKLEPSDFYDVFRVDKDNIGIVFGSCNQPGLVATTTVGAPDDAGEVLAPEMVEDPTMAEQALGAQAVAPNEEVI